MATEDGNTRYFIDIDLLTQEVVEWGFDQREKLAHQQVLEDPYHRIFVSKGQYNKLVQRAEEIRSRMSD